MIGQSATSPRVQMIKKLGGLVNMPNDCAAILIDLNRPENWVGRNLEVQQREV